MSRYTFETDGQLWHVGWDAPTASLFAQVEPEASPTEAAPMSGASPEVLPDLTGREAIIRRLGQRLGSRPPAGATAEAKASWLRDKATTHDQVAGYLREVGDVTGAVEAEVQASRCRIDADDLSAATQYEREHDDWESVSTGCPWAPGHEPTARSMDESEVVTVWDDGPGLP